MEILLLSRRYEVWMSVVSSKTVLYKKSVKEWIHHHLFLSIIYNFHQLFLSRMSLYADRAVLKRNSSLNLSNPLSLMRSTTPTSSSLRSHTGWMRSEPWSPSTQSQGVTCSHASSLATWRLCSWRGSGKRKIPFPLQLRGRSQNSAGEKILLLWLMYVSIGEMGSKCRNWLPIDDSVFGFHWSHPRPLSRRANREEHWWEVRRTLLV